MKNIVKFQATKGESVKGILASNATSYTKTTRTTLVVSFTHLSPLMVMVVENLNASVTVSGTWISESTLIRKDPANSTII